MTTSTTDRDAKRNADRERLSAAVSALQSDDGWIALRNVRRSASIRRLSIMNQLMVMSQAPNPQMALSYRAWSRIGCQVRRGEKAVRIFAPRPFTEEVEVDGKIEERTRVWFKTVAVFTQDQVDGDVPDTTPTVTGDSHESHIERLAEHMHGLGYEVSFGAIPGSASGYCNPSQRRIAVDGSMEPNAVLSVLIHECAHAIGEVDYKQYSRADAEAIVEAVAWLVAGGCLGMDTSEASVSYIAGWASGQSTDALREYAATIDRIAKQIEDVFVDAEALTVDRVAVAA